MLESYGRHIMIMMMVMMITIIILKFEKTEKINNTTIEKCTENPPFPLPERYSGVKSPQQNSSQSQSLRTMFLKPFF
jgi:hypothetical protein